MHQAQGCWHNKDVNETGVVSEHLAVQYRTGLGELEAHCKAAVTQA